MKVGDNMIWDYSKLNGKIVEICGTQAKFAKTMGISEHTVSEKLNSKRDWKQQEIQKICIILNINVSDIPTYFFAPKSSEKLS